MQSAIWLCHINPALFPKSKLNLRTHKQDSFSDKYYFGNYAFDHGLPVYNKTSCNNALGIPAGSLWLGSNNLYLKISNNPT